MDVMQLFRDRYSVRKFCPTPVREKDLNAILEAGRLAPTAVNRQPQRIFVLQQEKARQALKDCTAYTFDAPCILVVCYEKDACWKRGYDGFESGMMDASIVATHMMLAAHALGLGSTWVCAFDPKKAREILRLSEKYEIACFLPLGYPAENAHPSENHAKRFPLSHIVFSFDMI